MYVSYPLALSFHSPKPSTTGYHAFSSCLYHKCDRSNRPIICSPNSNFAAAPIPCLLASTTILTHTFGSFFIIFFLKYYIRESIVPWCVLCCYTHYTSIIFITSIFFYSKAHSPTNTPITKKQRKSKREWKLYMLCLCSTHTYMVKKMEGT